MNELRLAEYVSIWSQPDMHEVKQMAVMSD